MKKVLLVLTLLLALVACNNKKEVSDNPFLNELLVKDQLIIGISPDYPPYEDLDTNGNIIGFDVDMMEAIIAIINEDNNLSLKLQWKSMDFDNIIGALQTNQIDIGVSGFTYDEARKVYFSVPYLITQQVVIVSSDSPIKDLVDLVGKKVGAQSGTTGESCANDIENAKVISLTDAQQLFAQLQTNAIDVVIIDKPVAENFVKNNPGYVILEEALLDEVNHIIVATDKVAIQKVIDDAITKFVASPAYGELLKKWEIKQ